MNTVSNLISIYHSYIFYPLDFKTAQHDFKQNYQAYIFSMSIILKQLCGKFRWQIIMIC